MLVKRFWHSMPIQNLCSNSPLPHDGKQCNAILSIDACSCTAVARKTTWHTTIVQGAICSMISCATDFLYSKDGWERGHFHCHCCLAHHVTAIHINNTIHGWFFNPLAVLVLLSHVSICVVLNYNARFLSLWSWYAELDH